MLLRCSSVQVNLPLLGNRLFMSQSGAVIDHVQSKIFFHRFHVTRDLLLSPNSHLCIRIDEYPETGFPRKADRWARDARHEFAGQGLVALRSIVPRSLAFDSPSSALSTVGSQKSCDNHASPPLHTGVEAICVAPVVLPRGQDDVLPVPPRLGAFRSSSP